MRYSLLVLAFGDLGLGHGALGFCASCLILDGELLDVAADFKADFALTCPSELVVYLNSSPGAMYT